MTKRLQPTGYKVRMMLCNWHILTYTDDRQLVEQIGPLTFAEAKLAASKLGLIDIDKAEYKGE